MKQGNDIAGREIRLRAPDEAAGLRLDVFLSRAVSGVSRTFVKRLVADGLLVVAGGKPKAAYRLKGGEEIIFAVPAPRPLLAEPEPIPLKVIYEDEHLIAVDKPAGLVVHPCHGHRRGTLVNALLWHCRDLSGIGGALRPGIVHRLDKDTSGVIVCAKSDLAHRHLSAQFANRDAEKVYLAIVSGVPAAAEGVVAAPLGRHAKHRTLRAVAVKGGRDALTAYRLRETFAMQPDGKIAASLLECRPRSGRTHQIRVHLQHLALPILGDLEYAPPHIRRAIAGIRIPRLCLHAWKLLVRHPATGEPLALEAPLAVDLVDFLQRLRAASLAARIPRLDG